MARNRSIISNKKYRQGKYTLVNSNKYIGLLPILYRSSWEFFFCKWCDANEKVIKWSSESLEISYQITNNIGKIENHRYYPDFYVEMINDNPDNYDRFVIEIKPKSEISPPTPPKRQTLKMLENYEYALKTYKKNIHKWAFTKEWCVRKGLKFIIITEDDLKKRGLMI